jgi:ABC-2 type transport system ATP-binding protein
MPIVETRGLTKIYVQDVLGVEFGRVRIRLKNRRRVALEDLNLDVEEGEIFGMLGPNGAGKTTTIKILMGLLFATRGEAFIMGRPLGDLSVKSHIGFLPENPYFYDYLRGWEFLEYYGQLYGMRKSTRRKRIPELLDLVGLTAAANIPLKGYSKGMLQRIGLAQALLNDPKIVFLDEPQSGLDPFGRKEVRDIILRLKQEGKTVFFSSHILSDAEVICDRVAILNKGHLLRCGPLHDMLSTKIKEYEVVVSEPSESLISWFRGETERMVERRGEVLFVFREEAPARRLLDLLREDSGVLVSYTPRRETLEEYFIREIEGGRAA